MILLRVHITRCVTYAVNTNLSIKSMTKSWWWFVRALSVHITACKSYRQIDRSLPRHQDAHMSQRKYRLKNTVCPSMRIWGCTRETCTAAKDGVIALNSCDCLATKVRIVHSGRAYSQSNGWVSSWGMRIQITRWLCCTVRNVVNAQFRVEWMQKTYGCVCIILYVSCTLICSFSRFLKTVSVS